MADKKNQMAISDYNLQKVSTKELSEHLEATIQFGENMAIFGARGTGKTLISKQSIKRNGFRELYLNMSVLERPDFAGYPNILSPNRKDDFIDFILPDWMRYLTTGKEKVVALLDEVDKADPSLHAPLLEFTQFHTLNGRELPNLQAVIMTGNLISEGSARPSLPLLDRAEKYLVEADATSWLEWAGKEGHIHPAITSYINDCQDKLFGNPDPGDRYADPSPRGWERASQLTFKGESLGLRSDALIKKVAGCVGKEAGLAYSIYYEHYQELLPLIDEVFKGNDLKKIMGRYTKLNPTKKIVACMITCSRMAGLLDKCKEKEDAAKLKETANVGKFLNEIEPENLLVSVRSQIQLDRIMSFKLDEHKEWKPFFDQIHKQMGGGKQS